MVSINDKQFKDLMLAQRDCCINLVKDYNNPLNIAPWCPEWVSDRESGKDQEGDLVYKLDLSSVFMASVVNELSKDDINIILDLCASPGGKSVYAWRLLSPELLIANEVVDKRLAALISNFKRCEISPSAVTCTDIRYFSKLYERCGDLVIVDAPCSGQSLLAKGEGFKSAFSPHIVKMNAARQKKIIASAAACAAPQRYLAYMTCTFSEAENEKVCEWFMKKFPHFHPVKVNCLATHQSKIVDFPCYRLFPEDGFGAGGFTALFQNTQEGDNRLIYINEIKCVWKNGI